MSARRDATRARQLERAIRSAKRLQIAAYAASDSAYAASGAPMPTIGRYVFLEPTLPLEHAEVRLTSDDDLLQQDFPSLIALLLRGWQQGIFFPRLEDTHQREPNLCRRCELAEACIRGDSEARAKLRQLISTLQNRSAREEPLSSEEELLLGLWRLS